MIDPNVPTRNQIAKVSNNDPEMLKALERLFIVAGTNTPADIATLTTLIENAALDAGVAGNKSESYQQNFQKLDYIDFSRTGPHVAAARRRRMQWSEDDGTIGIGLRAPQGTYSTDVMLKAGQEIYIYAQNTSSVEIDKGTPVMFTGALEESAKITFAKAVADGSQPAAYMLGVAVEDIPENGFGYITSLGNVSAIDTTGRTVSETWADGDIIYFSPTAPGTWTNVRPTAPNLDLPVAVVLNASSAGGSGVPGSIFVRMKTGEAINELHDVEVESPSNGMVLIYNAGQSRWEANTITAGSNISITNTDGNISIAVSEVGVSGSFTAAGGEIITVTNGIITNIA